jgi:hypothetical protein
LKINLLATLDAITILFLFSKATTLFDRDSIPRSIAPISSVAGGDDTPRPRRLELDHDFTGKTDFLQKLLYDCSKIRQKASFAKKVECGCHAALEVKCTLDSRYLGTYKICMHVGLVRCAM